MELEHLELTNFLSFKHETIDFRDVRIALICGDNGNGKSSLLDAWPFCFWGEGRGGKLSDFINDEAETVRTVGSFKVEGRRYRKIRQYGEAGNVNELYIDKVGKTLEEAQWSLISDDDKRSTDQLLTNIIGLNFELAQNSIFFGQDGQASLITGQSQERKELVCQLLDVPFYKDASKSASDSANEINTKITLRLSNIREKEDIILQKPIIESAIVKNDAEKAVLTTQINSVNDQLTDAQIEFKTIETKISSQLNDRKRLQLIDGQLSEFRVRAKQIENDISRNNIAIEKTIEDGVQVVDELNALIDKKPEFEKKKSDFEVEISNLSGEKEKVKSLKASNLMLMNNKEGLDREFATIEAKIKDIDKKVDRIKTSGAICPVLGHQCDLLDENNKVKTIDELNVEKTSLKKDKNDCIEQLGENKSRIIECEGAISEVNERLRKEVAMQSKLEGVVNNLKAIDDAEKKLPIKKKEFRSKIDGLESQNDDLLNRAESTKVLIDNTEIEKSSILESLKEDFSKEFDKIQRRISALNDDLKELRVQEKKSLLKSGELRNQLDNITNLESDVNIIKQQIEELKIEQRVFTELSFAFGKNGIQKEIINGVIPILEAKANELLSTFRKDHRVKIKFDLDPVTAKGNAKKSGGLDIVITEDGKKPRLLNMYSGGEKVRIIFAILLSVSSLLTTRAGKRSETLIIDERIAALDSKGIEQFIEIIRYISQNFKKILIVSHIDELKQSFSQQFMVTKDTTSGSKVTLIS